MTAPAHSHLATPGVETELEPGTYFVFVDGYASGNQGAFTLDVDVSAP